MARSLRIEFPGAHYHVMARGNNGQEIFVTDDGRRLFLDTLSEVCRQTGWLVHAYVMMSNHYHLLIETPEPNLVAGMKWFQGAYTQRFNLLFQRRGHLFQGRYKAIPVASDPQDGGQEYFREVSTYIHINPFRAGLCGIGFQAPLECYAWSSYPSYCGLARKSPDWLVRSEVLGTWELDERHLRGQHSYKAVIEKVMRYEQDPSVREPSEFRKQIKRGWYIGPTAFRLRLDQMLLGRTKNDNYRGNQRREHGIWEAERLLQVALAGLEWTEEALHDARSVDLRKQAVAWLLSTHTTASNQWVSDRIGMRHRVNVSRAIQTFRLAKTEDVMRLKKRMLKCTG